MKRLPLLLALALTGLLAMAAPASADDFKCNGAFTGTFDNVVVPKNGACVLSGSTVKGNILALKNAYFESDGTSVGGNVQGDRALTLFVHNGSTVGGSVQGDKTAQLFLFDSTVTGDIQAQDAINPGFGAAQVCGMTVHTGNVQVKKMGPEILIGDPLAVDCAGNTVAQGDVQVEENFTGVELVIRGNTIPNGNLQVFKNRGPAEQVVQSNTGGGNLQCKENEPPFVGSPNSGWEQTEGQCS